MYSSPPDTVPVQKLPVYLAEEFNVVNGANMGDALSFADELSPDDIYELSQSARQGSLSVSLLDNGDCFIAQDSALGTPGAQIYPDCCLTFMPATGETTEVVVLVEVDAAHNVAQIYAAPTGPLHRKIPYTLVGVKSDNARIRMAQLACVSFSRGTHITMSDGTQRPVEDISVGDRVLTRDDGMQAIRWVGQNTQRAAGEFAPIVITAGTLNNAHDLIVSPEHRLFIYQREDTIGAGRPELMVKARHLVNGTSVYVQEGGFVDYFQILFDSHQIIFAEGICAETLQVDTRTRPMLPKGLIDRLSSPIPGISRKTPNLTGLDVHENLLNRPDAADLLRRASTK